MLTRRLIGIDPLASLRNNMDRMLDGFLDGGSEGVHRFAPGAPGFGAIDVWEDGDDLFVEVDVPGLQLDQIEVTVEEDELTIAGNRPCRDLENAVQYCRERGATEFRRVIRLPVGTDTERVAASLKNGVLTVTLPKVEDAKPKRIEVKGIE